MSLLSIGASPYNISLSARRSLSKLIPLFKFLHKLTYLPPNTFIWFLVVPSIYAWIVNVVWTLLTPPCWFHHATAGSNSFLLHLGLYLMILHSVIDQSIRGNTELLIVCSTTTQNMLVLYYPEETQLREAGSHLSQLEFHTVGLVLISIIYY